MSVSRNNNTAPVEKSRQTYNIESGLVEAIKEAAEEKGISRSSLANRALKVGMALLEGSHE